MSLSSNNHNHIHSASSPSVGARTELRLQHYRGDLSVFIPNAVYRPDVNLSQIVTYDEVMQLFLDKLKTLAGCDVSFVLLGETGVGKGFYANAVHKISARGESDIALVDCTGLPMNLIESELFGHVQGAYTGANTDRTGLLLSADGGTAFLDEITEMPLLTQTKFLRFLNERKIKPLGSDSYIDTDVRVIAASNRDLDQEVSLKRLRPDLRYRLKHEVHVPSLRERPNDLRIMIKEGLAYYAHEMGKSVPTLTDAAHNLLTDYHWPGNVRELCTIIEGIVLFSSNRTVRVEDFKSHLTPKEDVDSASFEDERFFEGYPALNGNFNHEAARTWHALKVLELCNGNQSLAARALGMTRGALRAIQRNVGMKAQVKKGEESPELSADADSTGESLNED